MIDVRQYRVYVEPLAPSLGGGFVAYAPELPGCLSDGESPEEALVNIYDAIGSWLEGAEEDGLSAPEPQTGLLMQVA